MNGPVFNCKHIPKSETSQSLKNLIPALELIVFCAKLCIVVIKQHYPAVVFMMYFLYGESVSLSEIRDIAIEKIGASAKTMLPPEIVSKLREHGYDVKILRMINLQ